MALWDAYFDESGDDGRTTEFVIGGYVMTSEKANLMETEWKNMLDRYGLCAFHMVDCAPDPGNGEFAGWCKERRAKVATEAIGLINKYAAWGVCFITNLPKMISTNDVYSFCGANLLMQIEKFIVARDSAADLACFFEAGHASQTVAKKEFEDVCQNFSQGLLSRASVTFAPKPKFALLQAADLLCWQTSKFVKDKFITKKRRPRKDFLHLVRHSIHMFVYINISAGGNDLNWIPDQFPAGPDNERDKYLSAVFANTPESEEFLKEWHRAADAKRPQNTFDLTPFKKGTS
jgi:hypothetical protein